MRKVNYKEYVRAETGIEGWELKTQKEAAIFHRWGSRDGKFSKAIIELPDGTIKHVPSEHIMFVTETD